MPSIWDRKAGDPNFLRLNWVLRPRPERDEPSPAEEEMEEMEESHTRPKERVRCWE